MIEGGILQQLMAVWNALDVGKRLIVSLTGIAVFALVLVFARVANNPTMALLYAGLEPSVSGEIISALEKRGVAFSVSGDAIYVEASQRDLMRVSLAEEGLPATGNAGYELLDGLSGFGTTAQMFDAAYWRAKEGELARTILAWPQIKSARVHIANQTTRPFGRATPPVASVTLKMSNGALSAERARALRFLIASAVSGMAHEDVSIIDSDRGLIGAEGDLGGTAFQSDRAAQIRQNVERLMAARVGHGNAIVEVSVDTQTEQEKIVERRFDPEGRVAISTDTEEVAGNSSDTGTGAVTVASNLPEGDAASGGTKAKSSNSETRERVNYEVSETTRELIKHPGAINRISVAVMVNGLTPEESGASEWRPRSDEELASLRELVESAIGFNAERGDQITIKSLELLPVSQEGVLAQPSPFSFLTMNAKSLIQYGTLGIVILGLGIFVLRPILTNPPMRLLDDSAPQALEDGGNPPAIELPPQPAPPLALDPVAQLRQLIAERQDESVEVLRNWIESSEERAG